MELRRGAHLPFSGHWARRWIYHCVCDEWPVRRQTYGYLPSLWPVPIYTAWWTEAHCVWTICPESLREAERSGLEPANSRLQVRRPIATTPPRHTCRGVLFWCTLYMHHQTSVNCRTLFQSSTKPVPVVRDVATSNTSSAVPPQRRDSPHSSPGVEALLRRPPFPSHRFVGGNAVQTMSTDTLSHVFVVCWQSLLSAYWLTLKLTSGYITGELHTHLDDYDDGVVVIHLHSLICLVNLSEYDDNLFYNLTDFDYEPLFKS